MKGHPRAETAPTKDDPRVGWRAFSVLFRPAATKSGAATIPPSRMTDEQLVWVSNVIKREIARRVKQRGLERRIA